MSQPVNPDRPALDVLRYLGQDPDNWVPKREGIDHNVVVVGGGHTGSTFAFALRRAGIGGVSVIDAAPDETRGSTWLTRARMNKLRTPKSLQGPELGHYGLSFQSWYEQRHGVDAYAAIDRIPRLLWADYISWYRRILNITIRYGSRLVHIEPTNNHLRLHLEIDGRPRVKTTRKLILANGVAGSGGAYVPPAISRLPKAFWAHTSETIDFSRLEGKTIAVIGSAASAFDAAGAALEAGAADVRLFSRRSKLASVPISRLKGYPGAYDNYPHLSDAIRWTQARRFSQAGSTPPPDAIERVVAFSNFHLHLGATWDTARVRDDRIAVTINDEDFTFDYVIAGTGYFSDPHARPEFEGFADKILTWGDRYTPPPGEADAGLATHPYLGLGHEFLEKTPGTAPFLKDIHVFNPGGFVSFGLPIGDVPSLKRDIPSVVGRISRDLFLADLSHHERRITGTIAPEFGEELYTDAIWRGLHIVAAE